MREWAYHLGLKYKTLQCRLNDYGWSVEKAFTTPVGKGYYFGKSPALPSE